MNLERSASLMTIQMVKETWVKKAAEKSAQDSNYVYRVRGNPKNGLRLVSFNRANLNSS